MGVKAKRACWLSTQGDMVNTDRYSYLHKVLRRDTCTGKTKCEDENDLSLERLSSDLVSVLREVFPPSTTKHPSLVLVGHSMGGSVVVRACPAIQSELKMGVVGVVNLDVVEGTAMEFLGNMMDIIQGRPKGFESLEKAIEWQ